MLIPILAACTSGTGVPLESFEAKDNAYFPKFITDYFEAADKYIRRYPSLAESASGVRIIQVKRLTNTEDAPYNESNLAWSADSVYLSFETVDGSSRRIQVKNLKGDYQRDLLVVPKGRSDFLEGLVSREIHSYNAGLSWSRDSTRFAFMSNGGMGVYNIFIGAVGVKERPVVTSNAKDGYAAWGPDGKVLSFVSSRSGSGDIYLFDVESEQLTRLTRSNEVDLFPVWSPNGEAIVFSSGDNANHNIVMIRREKNKWQTPTQVTHWAEDDLRPTFSPNGKLIAFYASQPGTNGRRWNIHVVSSADKNLGASTLNRRVIASDVVVDLNTGPAWSPDSQKIFYVKRDPDRFNPIHAFDLYSGRRYRLNTGTQMNRDILMSNLGVLSFRAQVGVWDRVFLALTNQGSQLRQIARDISQIHYGRL